MIPLSYPRDTSQFIISGTETFRLGSKKILSSKKDTPYNNFGGNRQNIEKKMRVVWEADKGYKLCQVDQSGAEALIVAYLCAPLKYRSLFQNGIKPHTYLALKLFPDIWKQEFDSNVVDECLMLTIPALAKHPQWKQLAELIKSSDDWAPSKRYYHFAKKTIHASSYGMKENTFRTSMLKESEGTIVLPHNEAKRFLLTFHKEFPEILEWHWRILKQAKATNQLRNLFNYPYNITDYVNENDYKDLIAWIPQSTVACITRQAYVKLYNYASINSKDWHILNDCHDSYLAEAPEDEIPELVKVMKEFIEVELISPLDGSKFKMKSEAAVGYNWASYDKEKNPEGLQTVR